jgi:hypothetical protein
MQMKNLNTELGKDTYSERGRNSSQLLGFK